MQAPAFLKKKVAGLPVGVWLLIIGAGATVGIYLRKRALDPMTEGEVGADEDGFAADSGESETVPYDALPMDNTYGYGDYPLSGGGPPVVYGGQALRITPETLRIRLVYPKRRRKRVNPGTHRCRNGYRWNAAQKRCMPVRRSARRLMEQDAVGARRA